MSGRSRILKTCRGRTNFCNPFCTYLTAKWSYDGSVLMNGGLNAGLSRFGSSTFRGSRTCAPRASRARRAPTLPSLPKIGTLDSRGSTSSQMIPDSSLVAGSPRGKLRKPAPREDGGARAAEGACGTPAAQLLVQGVETRLRSPLLGPLAHAIRPRLIPLQISASSEPTPGELQVKLARLDACGDPPQARGRQPRPLAQEVREAKPARPTSIPISGMNSMRLAVSHLPPSSWHTECPASASQARPRRVRCRGAELRRRPKLESKPLFGLGFLPTRNGG